MDPYLLVLGPVAAFFGWRWIHSARIRQTIARSRTEGATVIDVRSPAEFAGGHVAHSLNIPLTNLADAPLAVGPQRWLIVCCASGARSAVARGILRRRGFARVVYGGSWTNVARGLGE